MDTYFAIEDGILRLTRPFPESMTWTDALELAIAKWELIVQAHEETPQGPLLGVNHSTCALCDLEGRTNACRGCPVREATGGNCMETPYSDYIFALTPDQALDAAKAEVRFLKSLRVDARLLDCIHPPVSKILA